MTVVFAASAWSRLLVAGLYAVAVAAAVWAVEARTPAAAAAPAPAVAAGQALAIRAEATFPVAAWTVLVDGVAVTGRAGSTTWTGSAGGREVLVQAERADPADLSPGALRLSVGARSTVAWGEGTVSATLDAGGR